MEEQSDIRDQKLAELEGKLRLANQVIVNLQQQNLALKKQFQEQQSNQTQLTEVVNSSQKLIETANAHNNSLEARATSNQSQTPKHKITHINRINQLSHLHFYGLVALVVCVIVGIFGISSFIARKNTSQQSKTASTQPQTPSVQTSLTPSLKPPASETVITNVPVTVSANPPVTQPIVVVPPVTTVNSAVNSAQYNVVVTPQFKQSSKLQAIVDDLTKQVKSRNLSTEKLSITLIDVNKNTIASYRQETPRFPASVAKLFWLVILQAKLQSGSVVYPENKEDMKKMIVESDNDAASKIIDKITGAPTFPKKLAKENYKDWKAKRESLNTFFEKAGYEKIRINQKTFPIPHDYGVNIPAPQGSDLQIRGDDPQKPIRNRVTSFQAARLMYEIVNNQAVSYQASQEMKSLLTRDLLAWQDKPFNPEDFHPVKHFLGESLQSDKVKFISKAGWTTNSRQEVAYVETLDGKVRYVIAVFGDDVGYAKSRDIFPEISDFVFKRMTS